MAIYDSADPLHGVERAEVKTTSPDDTLAAVRGWLLDHTFDGIGIASFGPVVVKRDSPKFGFITSTPKPGTQPPVVVPHSDMLRLRMEGY